MNKKKVLITGGTGMIGRAITKLFLENGFEVAWLTRKLDPRVQFEQFIWDPENDSIDLQCFENIYGIIHLAGASLATKRWTSSYKKIIYQSRVKSTRLLVDSIHLVKSKPEVLISTSAIGIYGNRPDETVDENTSVNPTHFLSKVCFDWEKEVTNLDPEIRSCIVRIGLVLSNEDGLYAKMKWPAMFHIASRLGDGTQMYSWIHIQDLARIFLWLIQNETSQGIYNATSPKAVSQWQFSKSSIPGKLRWSIPVIVPEFFLRIVLGEFAHSFYESADIKPNRLIKENFLFHYKTLEQAILNLERK